MIKALAHSGDSISIIKNEEGIIVVKKQTNQSGYRLQQQASKQKLLRLKIKQHKSLKYLIEVPEIVFEEKNKEYFKFGMKYYAGCNIIDILESRNISYLDEIIYCLDLYINWEFSLSSKEEDWQDLLLNKLSNLNSTIDSSIVGDKIFSQLMKLVQNFNGYKINSGFCHGDLTFSNMVFMNKIILIDMLPVYHETPIQDMVKLMQEVRLEWSSLLLIELRDPVKIRIAYNYLRKKVDSIIKNVCDKYNIDYSIILIYYIITIIRIIPYASEKKVVLAIQKQIIKTLKEIKNVSQ